MMTMLRPRRDLNGQTRTMLARIPNGPSGFDIEHSSALCPIMFISVWSKLLTR